MDSALKLRFITGFFLIALVLLWVLYTPPPLFALFALIVLISIGGWEWGRLVQLSNNTLGIYVASLILVAISAYFIPSIQPLLILFSVIWWAAILYLLATYKKDSFRFKDSKWILPTSAYFVLIPAWLALIALHNQSPYLVLYLIFLIAIADSCALFAGKAFGKNKLAPQLSPGKTREGALGGLIGSTAWAVLSLSFLEIPSSNTLIFILLSMAVALLSIAGDLFESLIKREAGQKDSGTILPGHGGILDRVDGILAALPLFTLGFYWMSNSI